MDQDAFKAAIQSMKAVDFCRRYLFDQSSWVFKPDSGISTLGSYQDFQLTVAESVDTNPNNVAIVGSAKFGFSMAPGKAYRNFHSIDSDIDVVIVSDDVFFAVWKEMREAIYAGYSHLTRHSNEVMLKYIVLGSEEKYSTNYLRETARTVKGLAAELNKSTRISNPFKFRIYSSWRDVELYHAEGVEKLKGAANVH